VVNAFSSVDLALFRFINSSLSNGFFDWLMPWASNPPGLTALLLLVLLGLIWKGGVRGRVCVLMLALALCLGNWLVCDTMKNAVGRVRPFQALPGVHLRVGAGGSFSLPSSHAANWFSFALVLLVYYRRTIWFTLPPALLVCLSRIYNGVHYPSDVLAGALLGAGYSAAVIGGLDALWQSLGPRWFPIWHARLPSLVHPVAAERPPGEAPGATDSHWLRLGYVLVALFFGLRLAYLGSGKIELSEDEAYQWIWSKHPALSYYSKPPLIAGAQFLGTHLWGDNEFGVRFFSPVIAAVLSVLVLRFLAREAGGRLAFIVFVIISATPLTALGATVMTVDPLSVLFWTAALVAGWRAAQPDGTTLQWLWVGLWMGLGFLSKYTNLFQYLCWGVFFLLWPPARRHLRRPGPYWAALVGLLCTLPVVIWNAQHQWITVEHVATDGQLDQAWHRTYVADFLLTEAAALHPVFFVAALWAAAAFWRRGRREPLQLYLFSMGAPLFLFYFLLSWHSHILGNWIAPAVIPLFCLMAVYWEKRWEEGATLLKPLLMASVAFGALAVVFMHDSNLANKVLHRKLPARLDLLRRVRGWKETAQIAGQARKNLEKQGPPAFIICEHYGLTSQITFYLPEAKRRVVSDPLVFFYAPRHPWNQFYFWPNYLDRAGQNALFVRQISLPALRPDWFSRWWRGDPDVFTRDKPDPWPLPPEVQQQFDSFTDLGIKDVVAHGAVVRRVQLFECHHLR
jgi:4-amino-4-deoxy-L-arabinose transferase-like glycosyltransferase/membrane-associated phospholipid phosphatase